PCGGQPSNVISAGGCLKALEAPPGAGATVTLPDELLSDGPTSTVTGPHAVRLRKSSVRRASDVICKRVFETILKYTRIEVRNFAPEDILFAINRIGFGAFGPFHI